MLCLFAWWYSMSCKLLTYVFLQYFLILLDFLEDSLVEYKILHWIIFLEHFDETASLFFGTCCGCEKSFCCLDVFL